jgi:toxin ParE1/3/4
MAEVIFSARAIRDIESIYAYIAKDSERYAQGQVRRIFNASDLIAAYPRAGKMVREIGHPALREVVVGNYRIIYHLENDDRAEILVVFHAKRRFPYRRITGG